MEKMALWVEGGWEGGESSDLEFVLSHCEGWGGAERRANCQINDNGDGQYGDRASVSH